LSPDQAAGAAIPASDPATAPVEPRAVEPPHIVRHRGWFVVAGAFLVMMVGYGAIYSYSAFAEEIAAAFGVERASVSVVFALSGSSCFFVSAVSGPLADRVGARVLAASGMVLVGIGLMVAAAATSLFEVYLGYGLLIGIGTGFAYVPAIASVQRWFDAHRGLASGIAVSGVGIGTALVAPAVDALEAVGDWRVAFILCGVAAVLVGLAGAMLLSPSPGRLALEAEPGRSPRREPIGRSLAVLRSRAFGFAYLGTLLVSVAVTLPYALLVETARGLGIARHDAVALLTVIGLGSIAGRFLIAALADRVGRRGTFLACSAGLAASMLLWATADGLTTLRAFAVVFGALHGGFIALLPAFIADTFGARSVGGVLGMLYTSRGIALLAGPPALAFGIGATAGHLIPVLGVVAVAAVGAAALAAVRPPDQGRAGE